VLLFQLGAQGADEAVPITDPTKRIEPDKEAFGRVVQDLVRIKKDLNLPATPENTRLGVHPATDCVSCHTESTRRHLISGLTRSSARLGSTDSYSELFLP